MNDETNDETNDEKTRSQDAIGRSERLAEEALALLHKMMEGRNSLADKREEMQIVSALRDFEIREETAKINRESHESLQKLREVEMLDGERAQEDRRKQADAYVENQQAHRAAEILRYEMYKAELPLAAMQRELIRVRTEAAQAEKAYWEAKTAALRSKL